MFGSRLTPAKGKILSVSENGGRKKTGHGLYRRASRPSGTGGWWCSTIKKAPRGRKERKLH